MRTIILRASEKAIEIRSDQGIRFMDSAPVPLVEISAEDGSGKPSVPVTVCGSDWLGPLPVSVPAESSSFERLSAGELLDAMLESDPDEVLLAVSAWLGVHAGRVRG